MMANKSKGTKIELLLGKMLWNAGIRYRKNDASLPGTPDFSIRKARVAVFCDGEFWHGHDWEKRKNSIKTNRDFWYAKIERNIERDELVNQQLIAMGWKVFRFWEDDIRREPERCMRDVLDYVHTADNDRMPPSATYGSACNKVNLYGPHSYNRDGSIMSVNNQMAVVSHYLHNYGRPYADVFATEGDGLIEDIREDSFDCGMVGEEDVRTALFNETFAAPLTPPADTRFTFVDLFAGIGGIRTALQMIGGRCVFASEWNAMAARQYFSNFGEAPFGDITKEETKTYIPHEFDMLCASVPVQAFALMNRRNITDRIKGSLFSEIADVIRRREPKAVMLEFPASQMSLSGGRYRDVMTEVLTRELGYTVVEPRVLDTSDYGSAMCRKCMYIIAFANAGDAEKFKYPDATDTSVTFGDVKEKETVSARYYLSETAVSSKDNPLSFVADDDKVTLRRNTVVVDTRTTDILPSTRRLSRINHEGIRRITPREHARMVGFPDNYRIVTADSDIHGLLRNASPVMLVSEVAKQITACIDIERHIFRYGSK